MELRSRRGRALFRARLDPGIRPDTVFAPSHWVGANLLTNPALDPHSKMPAFKACAVAIASIDEGTRQVHSTPRFLQGVFTFEGKGLDQPVPLDGALSYVVPAGTSAQAVYFRGGNSSDELIWCGADARRQADALVPDRREVRRARPLRVVEDLDSGTAVELYLAAPPGRRRGWSWPIWA